MKSTIIFVLAASLMLPIYAQEEPFTGNIELRAPKRTNWEINIKPSAAMKIAERKESKVVSMENLTGTPNEKMEKLVRIKVEKSDSLYHQTFYYDNGKKLEKWSMGPIQFQEMKNGKGLMMPSVTLLDKNYSDFSREDFEELAWISEDYYKGVIIYQGKKCYLFQVDGAAKPLTRREKAMDKFLNEKFDYDLPPENPTTNTRSSNLVTVVVSASTGLPVIYNDGLEVRTYSFQFTGLSRLVPPMKFQKEFIAWKRHLDEAKRPPVAP